MAVNHVRQSTPDWTDSEDYLERLSWLKTLDLLVPIVFMLLLMLIGIPGNALVLFIFWKYMKASSTRVFLLSLAVCDFVTNIFSLPFHIVRLRFTYNFPDPGFCQAVFVFQRFPVMLSGWLLVAVALDRRHRICQALKPQMNPRQAACLVLVSTVLASLATFPFVHSYGNLSVTTDRRNVSGSQCGATNKQETSTFRELENVTLMLSFLLGILIMAVCYAHIAYRLRQQRHKKRRLAAPPQAGDAPGERRSAEPEGGGVGKDGPQTDSKGLHKRDVAGADDSNMASTSTPSSALQGRTTSTPANLETTTGSRDTDVKVTAVAKATEESTLQRRKIVKRAEGEAGRGGSRKAGSRTTLMMFVLTVTAIVVFLPFTALKCLNKDDFANCQQSTGWWLNVCLIGLLFPNINSAINPFIYSFCIQSFRRRCRQVMAANILHRRHRRFWD